MVLRLSIALLLLLPLGGLAQSWAWDDGTVPYVQSPPEVVDRMLRLADPKPGELLIDLGSGDGRIVIEAARKYRTRGLGVDIDPNLVELARTNARKAGVESLARFEAKDFFELDFGNADIVTAYLLPEINLKLMPKLLKMKPGSRLVTHDFDMGPWQADETIELAVAEKLIGPIGRSKVFLFVVPADVRGTWRSNVPEHGGHWEFRIKQTYQKLEIAARAGVAEEVVRGSRLRGTEIRMIMSGVVAGKPSTQAFRGVVKGDRIEGNVTVTGSDDAPRSYPWIAIRAP